jgi:FecR protein
MKLARWKAAIGVIFLVAVLSVPAWSANSDNRHTAVPGTLNYVEGQASIGDQTLDPKSVGSVDLQAGQILKTSSGKAELLLTPGVYLRVGDNSSVKMVSPNLTSTELALNQGAATLEVDEIHSENNIRIAQPGASTRVLKTGLYEFNAANHDVRVFDGKAAVEANDRNATVKGGNELDLNAEGRLKPSTFDKKQAADSDDLYRWSSLRSQYLSEANVETARVYVANGWYGLGSFGPGWYWDPWFGAFTFLPADGFLYNPFGWGFYSPLVVYRVPIVHAGPHVARHFDGTPRHVAIGNGLHDHSVRSFHGAPPMTGFHSAPPARPPR